MDNIYKMMNLELASMGDKIINQETILTGTLAQTMGKITPASEQTTATNATK